jgi:hypothetical protein
VELETRGDFRTGAGDDSWKPFAATQKFSTLPPGFVWDARIRMAPFMPVYVRDAYVTGRSEMRGRAWGLFAVVDEHGRPELASGQLHRYLAETMWFPTALLPGHGVSWQPIDTQSAVATLQDGTMAVSLRFLFTPDGDVREVFAIDRMRAIDGRYEPTPWVIRCDDHQIHQNIRIPTRCEAEWGLPEGPLLYWRGRVTRVDYHLAR